MDQSGAGRNSVASALGALITAELSRQVRKAATLRKGSGGHHGASHPDPGPPHGTAHSLGGHDGHWVTIHGHAVFIDEDGRFHFRGPSSPAIDPDAPDFHARVSDALAHPHVPFPGSPSGAVPLPGPHTFRRTRLPLNRTATYHSSLQGTGPLGATPLPARGAGVAGVPDEPSAVIQYNGRGFLLSAGNEYDPQTGYHREPSRARSRILSTSAAHARDRAEVALVDAHAQALAQYAAHHRAVTSSSGQTTSAGQTTAQMMATNLWRADYQARHPVPIVTPPLPGAPVTAPAANPAPPPAVAPSPANPAPAAPPAGATAGATGSPPSPPFNGANQNFRQRSHELSVADLRSADLTNANLSGLDLHGRDLTGADLSDAFLHGTNLTNADLTRADLTNATLQGAKLDGANLTGAALSGTNLTGATLTNANLTGAHLSGAHLHSADLSRADLSLSNLSGARLRGTDLTRADLTGADLSGADLTGANLTGAYLTGCIWSGAVLGGTIFGSPAIQTSIRALGAQSAAPVPPSPATAVPAPSAPAPAPTVGATGAVASRHFNGAGQDFRTRQAQLRATNLTGADLSGANLSGLDLSQLNLSSAMLRNANLTGTNLSRCNLYGASLVGANLTNANVRLANLRGAVTRGCTWSGALISRGTIFGSNAIGDPIRALAAQPAAPVPPPSGPSPHGAPPLTHSTYALQGVFPRELTDRTILGRPMAGDVAGTPSEAGDALINLLPGNHVLAFNHRFPVGPPNPAGGTLLQPAGQSVLRYLGGPNSPGIVTTGTFLHPWGTVPSSQGPGSNRGIRQSPAIVRVTSPDGTLISEYVPGGRANPTGQLTGEVSRITRQVADYVDSHVRDNRDLLALTGGLSRPSASAPPTQPRTATHPQRAPQPAPASVAAPAPASASAPSVPAQTPAPTAGATGTAVTTPFNGAFVDLRNRQGGLAGVDLRGADLRGAIMTGMDLRFQDLTGANLQGAELQGANLSATNFAGAMLFSADLSGAFLGSADLTNTNLRGANLSRAYLRYANLSGADLYNANLNGATAWADCQWSGASLHGTLFTNSIMQNGVRRRAAWTASPVAPAQRVSAPRRRAVATPATPGPATTRFPLRPGSPTGVAPAPAFSDPSDPVLAPNGLLVRGAEPAGYAAAMAARDAFTLANYGHGTAPVVTITTSGGARHSHEARWFGRELGNDEYAGMVGAPDGATVSASWSGSGDSLVISTRHRWYSSLRTFERKTARALNRFIRGTTRLAAVSGSPRATPTYATDGLFCENQSFFTRAGAPAGVGSRVLGNQVKKLMSLRFQMLHVHGVGSRRHNSPSSAGPLAVATGNDHSGYCVWPKLGYQASFTPTQLMNARATARTRGVRVVPEPPGLDGIRDFNTLQSTDLGRAWWEEYGEGGYWFFDLREGSCQRAFQDEYHTSRGINLGPDPY